MNAPVGKNRELVRVLWLAVLGVALYVQTLAFDYALDDGLVLTDNPIVLKGFAGLPELFSKDTFYGVFGEKTPRLLPGGRYRPFTPTMFAIEYALFGLNPMVGHLVNVLLYALICVLVYRLLKSLMPGAPDVPWFYSVPFVAALLFAVHPLHTEVVANIKGRDEIVSLLGALGAMLLSVKYAGDRRGPRLLFSFVVFLVALLAKENAIAFVVIIPLALHVFLRAPRKTLALTSTPLWLAVACYLLLRFNALGLPGQATVARELLNNPFVFATASERFATTIYTWGRYLLLLVFPHPLTHDYYPRHIALIGLGHVAFIASLVAVLALAGAAVGGLRRRSVAAFAILYFFLSFFLQSNLVVNVGTFMNERFMFAPSLGFALLVAWGVGEACRRRLRLASGSVVPVLLMLVLAACSWKTVVRNPAWRSTTSLFLTDVQISSNSAACNLGAGVALARSIDPGTPADEKIRRLAQAEGYLRTAVAIHPQYIDGWVWLGYVQRERGNKGEGRESLEKALGLDRGNAVAVKYLAFDGCTLLSEGKPAESIVYFELLVRQVPATDDFAYFLVQAYEQSGDPGKAVEVLEALAARRPGNRRPLERLKEVRERMGDRDP